MGNLQSLLDNKGGGAAAGSANATAGTLLASIGYSFAAFGVQLAIFIILQTRLSRIYRPKSYLVPERQRVAIPPAGFFTWFLPIFKTPDLALVQRCGLDAYFFLRYLRMLLKIFVPAGCIILPILLPINALGGAGKTQLNVLSISNISLAKSGSTYWAHLVLGVGFLIWVGYVIYKELRGYIRVRQAYLASPQHRIRASATTVLVSGIPKKWLTVQALEGLYDVFPGGIRNIWINRNYDELSTKVQKRDNLAKQLENAETNLIKLCRKKHLKTVKSEDKAQKDITHELSPIERDSISKQHSSGTKASQEQLVRDSIDGDTLKMGRDDQKTTTPPEHVSGSKIVEGLTFWRKRTGLNEDIDYDKAYNEEYDQKNDEHAVWRQFIKPQDRETIRLPLIKQDWFPALPFVGKKVDRIYHIRCELARLNLEIKTDQRHPENFPLMNSAFIQFNHQVAAHMACQSVNHHVPLQMAPRLIEISPDDVLWDNMSIKWWERYIRSLAVLLISIALIIFYAIPVAFSAALGNLGNIGTTFPGLAWLSTLSSSAKSVIQGIGPPLILAVVLLLVPIIYGFLVELQGVPTGNARELGVQKWYFAFLFIQVFFVASISSGLLTFFKAFAEDPSGIASTLGQTLPQAANYFLSYITVQALGNSAGALLQIVTLLIWFLLAPLVDSTPRDKWSRQTNLSNVQWGSFFPPFTNFAVIGIIYGVIAPIIIPFVVLIFGLFWIVYRYNILYVYAFKHDTGGLLFPAAVNQLFTGLYFLSLCLIGLFFVARDESGYASAVPQGVIMVVVLVLTIIYQYLLNDTFGPLLRYMPITLEDDAVIRDEEFARAQASRFAVGSEDENSQDIQDQLKDQEDAEQEHDKLETDRERQDIAARRSGVVPAEHTHVSDSWHANQSDGRRRDPWKKVGGIALKPVEGVLDLTGKTGDFVGDKLRLRQINDRIGSGLRTVNEKSGLKHANDGLNNRIAGANGLALDAGDTEAQAALGDVLFSGLADELEDLTPEQRDLLVRYAFQHSALRARQPIVWIPRDELGVSDDEVTCAMKLSKHLPMSNTGTHLDVKGKVVFERSPPDFSNTDLIAL